jgi:hypothetical protein
MVEISALLGTSVLILRDTQSLPLTKVSYSLTGAKRESYLAAEHSAMSTMAFRSYGALPAGPQFMKAAFEARVTAT